jgi:hypothetical protein
MKRKLFDLTNYSPSNAIFSKCQRKIKTDIQNHIYLTLTSVGTADSQAI